MNMFRSNMIPASPAHASYSVFIIVVCVGVFLTACGDDYTTESGNLLHPIPDSIPHSDRTHIPFDTTRSIDERGEVPDQIALLAAYLHDPEPFEKHQLDVYVNDAIDFRVEAVGERRLALLDTEENRLLEYNLSTDEYVRIAEEGEGAGEILFSQDMARAGESIYVATPPLHVNRFDCAASPCTYDDMTQIGVAALSITPANGLIAALSETPSLGGGAEPDAEKDEEVVRLVDGEGIIQNTFGAAYPSEYHTIRHAFLRRAVLRYSEEAGRYVMSYRHFPCIYVYDEDGQLHASYEFDAEIEPVMEGRPGGYRWIDRDLYNSYYVMSVLDGLALVRQASTTSANVPDEESRYRYDYHVIDLQNDEAYHVGTDEYVQSHSRVIYPTDAGLVLNDGGTLYVVEM